MSTETNLKAKNVPYLWSFFVFNLTVLIVIFFAGYYREISGDLEKMLSLRTAGVLAAPLILFIINGLLSSEQKTVLVFWRLKDPLPGTRAFSVHAPRDMRIDMARLQSLHGNLPTSAKNQNALWYRIFKSNHDDIMVWKSHKDFLLARDMAAMGFLFVLFAGIPMLIVGPAPLNWLYFLWLVFQYSLVCIIAQNHGKRFVKNVLAVEGIK